MLLGVALSRRAQLLGRGIRLAERSTGPDAAGEDGISGGDVDVRVKAIVLPESRSSWAAVLLKAHSCACLVSPGVAVSFGGAGLRDTGFGKQTGVLYEF